MYILIEFLSKFYFYNLFLTIVSNTKSFRKHGVNYWKILQTWCFLTTGLRDHVMVYSVTISLSKCAATSSFLRPTQISSKIRVSLIMGYPLRKRNKLLRHQFLWRAENKSLGRAATKTSFTLMALPQYSLTRISVSLIPCVVTLLSRPRSLTLISRVESLICFANICVN
jgi:hypothetical protein